MECAGGMKYELEVRAFDDGAAVRTRIALDALLAHHRRRGDLVCPALQFASLVGPL